MYVDYHSHNGEHIDLYLFSQGYINFNCAIIN